MEIKEYMQEAEAAEFLAISVNTIRAMRRDGRLKPGDHYLFATGMLNGPVIYNMPAVIRHLAQLTIAAIDQKAATRKRRQDAIETYEQP